MTNDLVLELMAFRGFSQLSEPQRLAFQKGVEGSLVVACSTASGKTFIAEVAAVGTIRKGKKAVYLVPLRALASEKFEYFSQLKDVKVEMRTGDYDSGEEGLSGTDFIIATYQKFDSMVRHSPRWLKDVGLVIADEGHEITDQENGSTIEVLLTRLKEAGVRVLVLSAVMPNVEEVASWLGAGVVKSDWRPVPLSKGVYSKERSEVLHRCGLTSSRSSRDRLYPSCRKYGCARYGGGVIEFVDGTKKKVTGVTDSPACDLALDTVKQGGQALIFARSRRESVGFAQKIGPHLVALLNPNELKTLAEVAEKVRKVGPDYETSQRLASCIRTGSTFHNAGMARELRAAVEDSFRSHLVKVISSTPTLCLPEGEEIICGPEHRRIETLHADCSVLTHTGTLKKVVAPIRRPYRGALLKISPFSQLPMKMTPEHKVLRAKRTRHGRHEQGKKGTHWWTYTQPEWVNASELDVGDMVVFPRLKVTRDICRIPLPEPKPNRNQFGWAKENWQRLKINAVDLTPETLEVLGLFIAEGFTGRQGQVAFAISSDEVGLTQKITHWFSTLGVRCVVRDFTRHRRVVQGCSKQLASVLRNNFGHRAWTKHLPYFLYFLPEEKLVHLIRGMWLGDGTVSVGGVLTARYSTTSLVLAKQLFTLLVKIGLMPSLRRTRVGGGSAHGTAVKIAHKHDSYTVTVSGKQLERFGSVVLRKAVVLKGNRNFNRGYLDENFYYMPIRKIDEVDYEGTVFNLEVEGDSSYVGSFVVHNSAGINTPARRVIVQSVSRWTPSGWNEIPRWEAENMLGRAGRPGYDTYGEAILVGTERVSANELLSYLSRPLEGIDSKLIYKPSFYSHVLSEICLSPSATEQGITNLFSKTFYAAQEGGEESVRGHVKEALEFLLRHLLVRTDRDGVGLEPTSIGERLSKLYVTPLSYPLIQSAIVQRQTNLGYLQLATSMIDWNCRPPRIEEEGYDGFYDEYGTTGLVVQEGEEVSVREGSLESAFVLMDWIEEKPEPFYKRYGLGDGDFYTMKETADWLLFAAREVARLEGRQEAVKDLDVLSRRMRKGVKEELLDICGVKGVGRVTGRRLFNQGVRTAAEYWAHEEGTDRLDAYV